MNACLCGTVPSWIINASLPDGLVATRLGSSCPGSCAYVASSLPTPIHADWAGMRMVHQQTESACSTVHWLVHSCKLFLAYRPHLAGLHALRASLLDGPSEALALANTSWEGPGFSTPCHDADPNCAPCLLGALPGTCGTPLPNATTPAGVQRYVCNALGVACQNGRVSALLLDGSGLVMSSLPSEVQSLTELRELGEQWTSGLWGCVTPAACAALCP